MKHNRHKKQAADKRKLETKLISNLSPLYAQGLYLSSCVEKNATNKKYKIAKKRYLDLLGQAEKTIGQIRDKVNVMEIESIKEQKKAKLADLDKERNMKIRGEDKEEVPKHRKGWF